LETFKSFEEDLYRLNVGNRDEMALRLFRFQSTENPTYRDYLKNLHHKPVNSWEDIPFLPISFFRTQWVQTKSWTPEMIFTSSGTTGSITSRHPVKDLHYYTHHAEMIFTNSFGPLEDHHVLALLPSYLERTGSSLVVMADHFIRKSNSPDSGFYLDDFPGLLENLAKLKDSKRKVVLLGVTFALLDLAERYPTDLSHCIIMETGGMKGKRKEMIREELHATLCKAFQVPAIHSEYGMTELLSQAYSFGNGVFHPPISMKIMIRDINDPFTFLPNNRTGIVCVADLANVHTCAFIETQDLGQIHQDGSFEVLGRLDNSDLRGCNLLVQ
jgi:phenylacetate-coenzyme A ligase PaaK-like adenylate-forming protein